MRIIQVLLLLVMTSGLLLAQNSNEAPSVKKPSLKKVLDKGVRFLRKAQNKDGHWGDPGLTAIALTAIFKSPRKYGPQDGPWVRRPIQYLVSLQKPDGGIYHDQLGTYITSMAILALTANSDVAAKHKDVIEKAKKFLIDVQCDEGEGYNPNEDVFYGGIGYGGDERPDLSNTQFALEALRAAGVDSSDPVFKKATIFLQRCQNRSESNDLESSGNDGGFVYYPNHSMAGTYTKPDGTIGHRSYGSMTYAGIKSYVHADMSQDDPRVKAAYDWIKDNYTLTENPGVGSDGLFYYYHTFAKTFAILGVDELVDTEDTAHNWREDLLMTLANKQKEDGSWQNSNPRWWESHPVLATAYCVIALSYSKK